MTQLRLKIDVGMVENDLSDGKQVDELKKHLKAELSLRNSEKELAVT